MLFLILLILFRVTFQLYFQNYHHTCQIMSFGSVSDRILDIGHYFASAYNAIKASASSASLWVQAIPDSFTWWSSFEHSQQYVDESFSPLLFISLKLPTDIVQSTPGLEVHGSATLCSATPLSDHWQNQDQGSLEDWRHSSVKCSAVSHGPLKLKIWLKKWEYNTSLTTRNFFFLAMHQNYYGNPLRNLKWVLSNCTILWL